MRFRHFGSESGNYTALQWHFNKKQIVESVREGTPEDFSSVRLHYTTVHGERRRSDSSGLQCRADVGVSTGRGRIGVGEQFRPDIEG
jgi:hypothetical protein